MPMKTHFPPEAEIKVDEFLIAAAGWR